MHDIDIITWIVGQLSTWEEKQPNTNSCQMVKRATEYILTLTILGELPIRVFTLANALMSEIKARIT